MESTQYAKRKREVVDPSDSDGEHAHLTPQSSTYLIPNNPETSLPKTNRPRRAGVNYDLGPRTRACTFPRLGKRPKNKSPPHEDVRTQRQTRQLPPNEPPRSASLALLPSEAARPLTIIDRGGAEAEVPEVRELISGKARSNDLVVNNPAQGTAPPTISNITLGLELSGLSNNSPAVKQKKAGALLTHWRRGSDVEGCRPDSNHDNSTGTQKPEPATATTNAVRNMDHHATSSDSRTSLNNNLEYIASNTGPSLLLKPAGEESRIKMGGNERREVLSEDFDTSIEESSDRSSTQDEEGENALTPPPPPQHGFPGAVDEYRENVPVPNAPRWEGSAMVWDSHDHPDSSCVLFDSGSKPNFISWTLALRLGFQPMPLPEKQWELFSTLNGEKDLAQNYTKLDIQMKFVNFDRRTTYFLVVDSDEIDIVLGRLFLDEFGIATRLVANAQARTASNAFAIITSKPTSGMMPKKSRPVVRIPLTHISFLEQIQSVLLDRERRRKLAERADANIQEQTRGVRQGPDAPSRQGTSYTSSSTTARQGVYGPKMATFLNNSFGPAMGQDHGIRMPSHRQESMGSSSTNNSSFRDSLESSPRGSIRPSPATTSSSKSTGSASSSFGRMKQKVANPFRSKGKEGKTG
jgi:hypothetical protein